MDHGKKFEKTRIKDKTGGCADDLCDTQLILKREIKDFTKEWFITLRGEVHDSIDYHYLISTNGGKIWKRSPFPTITIKTLNQGGIYIGFRKKSNKIFYSFDEGKTYYLLNFPDENMLIRGSEIIGTAEKERLVVYGWSSDRSTMMIMHIDFTNVLRTITF
ncbi:hypothetical protein RF11_01662 [Thelohanellus kitauei]|uniref:Sortilin N-terminal domain-containing protein n=1 Tax=Thelohanellus kitauei TaxID=669202 RepID=A0A0C2MJX8_THEKT|nr:hypothetical protein RF11_01662 [Thelohanellus kitauei]